MRQSDKGKEQADGNDKIYAGNKVMPGSKLKIIFAFVRHIRRYYKKLMEK